jgi:hypothetical protein
MNPKHGVVEKRKMQWQSHRKVDDVNVDVVK